MTSSMPTKFILSNPEFDGLPTLYNLNDEIIVFPRNDEKGFEVILDFEALMEGHVTPVYVPTLDEAIELSGGSNSFDSGSLILANKYLSKE